MGPVGRRLAGQGQRRRGRAAGGPGRPGANCPGSCSRSQRSFGAMWKPDGRWPVRRWIASSPNRSRSASASRRGPVVAVDQPGRDGLAAPVDEDDRRALPGQPDRPDLRGPAEAAGRHATGRGRRAPRSPPSATPGRPARPSPPAASGSGRDGGPRAGAARRGRTPPPGRRTSRRRSRRGARPARPPRHRSAADELVGRDLVPLEGDQGAVEDPGPVVAARVDRDRPAEPADPARLVDVAVQARGAAGPPAPGRGRRCSRPART